MNVIHGTWIPENTQDFIQSGAFYLWIESDDVRNNTKTPLHPQHLAEKPCLEFLKNELAVNSLSTVQGTLLSLLLPTFAGKPLPSPELQHVEVDEKVTLQGVLWKNPQKCSF